MTGLLNEKDTLYNKIYNIDQLITLRSIGLLCILHTHMRAGSRSGERGARAESEERERRAGSASGERGARAGSGERERGAGSASLSGSASASGERERGALR